MTVSSVVNHEQYDGNGTTTVFPYRFRILKDSHMVVTTVNPAGLLTTLVGGTDYTITGVGLVSGGNVILSSPLATGWKVSLDREVPAVQETDLRNQGRFFPETHEDAFDYMTMLIQQSLVWKTLSLNKPSFIADFYDAKEQFISNLKTPVTSDQATNKSYVDDLHAYLMQTVNTIIDTIKNGLYGYNTKKSFELGNTLNYPNDALYWSNDGEYYRWDGALPKVVPAGSTPASTGGIGKGAWVGVGDASLRSDLNKNTGAGLSRTTSGNTVQEEIDHFKYGYKTPDDFGAKGDGVSDDTVPIQQAIAYCSANGIALRIPAKSYVWNGGTITVPITIIGDRRPFYNWSTNTMTNGSVIIGGMRFSANQVIIKSLGIKRPAGSPGDCLVLSTNNAAGASCSVEDFVGAGLSNSNQYHCLLVEGYDQAYVRYITSGYNLFGVAIKSRNVIARGIVTISCDTGVIIKSDSNFSTAKNVILDGHINIGNGVSSQGVWVYSTTAQLERVTCSNLQSTGTAIHMRIKSENVANDVQVNNANYSGSTYADVLVEGTAAGTLYNVSLNNVTAVNSQKFLAAGFCEQLMVTGFYGSLKSGAPADTAFEVSSAVGLFNGANIQLVRQYGSDLMTMNLGNNYLNNRLSSIKAKVIGSGKPRPGYKEQNVTGANANMIVGDSLGASGVVAVSATTAGSSFASISVNDDYGQPVRPGFLLIIRNAAAISFVMRHNTGTGGIANNGATDKTLSGGDTMMYLFDGTNWRQTPSI